MSIDQKLVATVKKKTKIIEERIFNLGYPPASGKECVPSFVWALRERTGIENVYYEYKDKNNSTCFYIRRYEPYDDGNPTAKKKIVPYSYDKNKAEWVQKAWPKDRSLFREHLLRDGNTVLIVEGEKTVLQAAKHFPNYDCISWSGGSKAVGLSTYEALKDKKVILFPDNDKPGVEAVHEIAKILIEQDITDDVHIVNIPKEFPERWDLADPINIPGYTYQGLLDSYKEYDADEYVKIWEKINKREDKKITKATAATISTEYCYVMANDMFNKIGSAEFYNHSQLNNFHSHLIKDATLTDLMLNNAEFAKAETFITSAKFKPGILDITKPGIIPLISRGKVLNIYIPNHLAAVKGDVKFLIDFFIWLVGRNKWKVIEEWIAYNIQYPGEKIKWSLVIVSTIEGAGKGLLVRIISQILGFENVNENANYKHLVNTHNTLLIGTQVLVLNEVSLGDFKSKAEGTNALKNFIADDYYSCNFKGKPMVKLPNFTNIIILSNDVTVVQAANGARRYFYSNITRTEEELIKITDEGFFEKAWNFVDSDAGGSALINYFKNEVKITDATVFKKRAPITADLIELQEQSKHPLEKKLEHDLTRTDLDNRKIFNHKFCGLMTFNELNEKLSTSNKDATEQYKWGSFGDDAIYKFLNHNATRWNDGATTRQVSIRGFRQRFHLLDDSRCPLPGKSYKDLTPKQIETIYIKYETVVAAIDGEKATHANAILGEPRLVVELKDKINRWCQSGKYGEVEYQGRQPLEVFNGLIASTEETNHNDQFTVINIIKMRAAIATGVRSPEQILDAIIKETDANTSIAEYAKEIGIRETNF